MLILTRKIGEKIKIGDEITITLLEIKGKQVKIGINASKDLRVHRHEIYEKIRSENLRSAAVSDSDLTEADTILQATGVKKKAT